MSAIALDSTPSIDNEVTIMSVWPSLAASPFGRWWGRRFENESGITLFGLPLTVGRLAALISIPFILPVYFHMLVPRLPGVLFGFPNSSCRRYRLTNRRVLVEHPFGGGVQQSVSLDRFDTIDLEVLPGQKWYRSGDLVFRMGQVETFRLSGVPNPESFRQTCMKANLGLQGVTKSRATTSVG